MESFPVADPIPLPAPVWLIKALSLLTLGLHFTAVMTLVGSLLLVVILNARGRTKKDQNTVQASHAVAKHLPAVMTYVINLGVPPLLFLQVLYGRQIYSSSVLIGTFWISVIGLLMLGYWLIYRTVHAIEHSKPAWPIALASLLLVMGIGQIYAWNMTLMLRPEVWSEMYSASPLGTRPVTGDPTTTPRWLFVMAGGPLLGGLWAALLSVISHQRDEVRAILRKSGSSLAVVGGVLMLLAGYRVVSTQPAQVLQDVAGSPMHNISLIACGTAIVLATLVAAAQFAAKRSSGWVASVGVVCGFLAATTAGIVRDGIRDFTLLAKGFDVNAQAVYPNWSVLAVFLLLFVIMLFIVVWLLMVMRQAKPPEAEVAL